MEFMFFTDPKVPGCEHRCLDYDEWHLKLGAGDLSPIRSSAAWVLKLRDHLKLSEGKASVHVGGDVAKKSRQQLRAAA